MTQNQPKTPTLSRWDVSEAKLAAFQQALRSGERLAAMAFLAAVRRRRLKQAWSNMNTRCYYAKASNFEWYGARGITVCAKWRNSFAAFVQWALANGFYTDLTLDREENSGNYTPKNCRWVTMGENNKNRQVSSKFMAAALAKFEKNKAKMWAAAHAARSRPVIASNGAVYPSAVAASRAIGRGRTAVSKCLHGICKQTAGLTWKYL